MLIRRTHPTDHAAAAALHRAAFPDGGVCEARLAIELRTGPWALPRMSLVAVDGGGVVGDVVASRGTVAGHPAVGIGPLGVVPQWQGAGIGSALMHAVVGAAQALDETLLVLLGSPRYYGRFGFVPASDLGVLAPDPAWGAHFQALALTVDAPRGTLRYADPFQRVAKG